MELVYFFVEPAVMRVPFFGYDRRLFGLLAAAGGGVWDNLRQEFVFKSNESTDVFDCSFFGIPCVKVDETTPVPVSVSGFLERPWEGGCPEAGPAGIPDVSQVVNNHGRKPLSPAFSAPERLSEYWRVKLETELRARKFSTQTRKSYIYYAQTLCRELKKTPEEILPGDVKQFLAIMEKAGYSAAAMNLALSSAKFFFSNVLNNDGVREQRRPRQDKKLPIVFSKDEIKKIIAMERNPKHRLLMMLVYSSFPSKHSQRPKPA
jgi:hypothetical protein